MGFEGRRTWSGPQGTSVTYLIPSMVCSEPLISKDAPPQWKCNCRAMYSTPLVVVMRMVGGRLICTGRGDKGQQVVRAGVDGSGLLIRQPPCSPAHSRGKPVLQTGLGCHEQVTMGGGDWHTGRHGEHALRRLG